MAPAWYPAGKYEHDGKDVLRITWQGNMFGNSKGLIHFTDGSSQETGADNVAQSLAKALGFKVHHTYQDNYDGGEHDFGREAVPEEDPDPWECYDENRWVYRTVRRTGPIPALPWQTLRREGMQGDFVGITAVSELRRRVADVLCVPVETVLLKGGGALLQDGDELKELARTGHVDVEPMAPEWYPAGKYVESRFAPPRDVLKARLLEQTLENGHVERKCQIFYTGGVYCCGSEEHEGTDGGAPRMRFQIFCAPPYPELPSKYEEVVAMLAAWGFVTHVASVGGKTATIAVPLESPEQWEQSGDEWIWRLKQVA